MADDIILNEEWVTSELARAIPTSYGYADVSIGRVVDGDLVGGVLYKEFTGESIRMSVASFRDGWLSRNLLWAAFAYPFAQLGCARVFSQISEARPEALAFNLKLGFSEVLRLPGVYPGGVGVVVTKMERAECRWLSIRQNYFVSSLPFAQRVQ